MNIDAVSGNQPDHRPIDATATGPESFAARGHARWMVTAGSNRREKGIHDAAFGHYGATVATVSFEHEYSHMPEYGAKMAADYAERLVACAESLKGVSDPRAFVASHEKLLNAARLSLAIIDPQLLADQRPTREQLQQARQVIEDAMLAALGGASPHGHQAEGSCHG